MPEPTDVRAEFDAFFESAYPWLSSQLRAITGDADTARWAVDEAFVRCWQSWASVRRTADPMGWVRWTALRVAAGTRRELPFRRRTPEPSAITEESEEAVVLDALHRLPASQRRAIVLHYMGDVTVAELARRSGTTPGAVEWLLDTAFDSLVGPLTWPDEPGSDETSGDESFDPRYDWTAEALGDMATRLAADVTVPAPATVLQRAAMLRWARRALPVAVSAACVSGVVVLAAQLNPGGATGPSTPYTYAVAGPAPYEAAPPDGGEPVVGGPAAAARDVPLGTSIVSVARTTPLADFGVSAPASPQAGSSRAAGGGGATGASGGGSPAGPAGSAGTTASGGSGGGAATPPAASGTVPPASGAPGTVPPGPVPPTTVPPTTTPTTTTPTTPPTTAPTTTPTSTTPTTTPTTAPTTQPTTTTAAPAATTTQATTTRATTTKPTPAEPTTTEAATTTTKPAPTPPPDPTATS